MSRKRTFTTIAVAGAVVLAAVLGVLTWDTRRYEAERQTLMTSAASSKVALKPAPINKDWIIEGTPKTETGIVASTYDGSAKVYVWRTTASKFKWYYDADEVVTILDGEVFITDTDGSTKHLKAGDVALFPVGAVLIWNVPDHVTKSAIVKNKLPTPFETAMRWLRKARDLVVPQDSAFG